MPIIEKHKNDSDIVKPTYAAHLVLDACCVPLSISRARWGRISG